MPAFLAQRQVKNARGILEVRFRVNLDMYYAPFLERLWEAKAKALERGCAMYFHSGFRPWAEQADLRAKFIAGKGGKAAPAGYSGHQFGIASDAVSDADLEMPGLQPTWDPKRYDVYGEEVQRVGLEWGASYGDRPHVNWPGFTTGKQLAPLREIWTGAPHESTNLERLRACWQYLDSLPIPLKGK